MYRYFTKKDVLLLVVLLEVNYRLLNKELSIDAKESSCHRITAGLKSLVYKEVHDWLKDCKVLLWLKTRQIITPVPVVMLCIYAYIQFLDFSKYAPLPNISTLYYVLKGDCSSTCLLTLDTCEYSLIVVWWMAINCLEKALYPDYIPKKKIIAVVFYF